jgi:hypothetical protein
MGNGLSCHFAWEMGYSYHAILHGKLDNHLCHALSQVGFF